MIREIAYQTFTFIVIMLTMLVILMSAARQAGAPIIRAFDDPLLQEICTTETRGHGFPTWAVNQYGTAFGRCQVKYWSAVHYCGFDEWARLTGIPTRSPGELFVDQVNIRCARDIVTMCRTNLPRAGNRRLAYCYYAGPHSHPYTNRRGSNYSKGVALRLAQRQRELAFNLD